MFELAVIVFRWLQMTGAMFLFGSSLFFIYALPEAGVGSAAAAGRWPRWLLFTSAAAVAVACVAGFLAQTVVLAGSVGDAIQPDALSAAAGMSFGKSSIVRAGISLHFAVAFAFMRPGRAAWALAALTGAAICASFAWMGHGAATPGASGLLHAASDVLHTLAAGVWVGALVVFLILVVAEGRKPSEAQGSLHAALHGFSGIGSGLVAVLVATGLINSWFVVGLDGLPSILTTPYGQLLALKLCLFVTMLGLAAANRFNLTPGLGRSLTTGASAAHAIARLRRTVALETGLGIAVIALVAWFGTLAPPSSG